jgi:hypothetical protein
VYFLIRSSNSDLLRAEDPVSLANNRAAGHSHTPPAPVFLKFILILSSHIILTLPSAHFSKGFPIKIVYRDTFLVS